MSQNSPTVAQAIDGDERELAGIAYHGIAGSSYDCLDAVKALLQCRTTIARVRILSAGNDHGLLLLTTFGDPIAIKSGFASGYGGTGPKTFSVALALLDLFEAQIDEIAIDEPMLRRLDQSALTLSDLDRLMGAPALRPCHWNDYITDEDFGGSRDGSLTRQMQAVMPYGIIDVRLADLACTFWTDSDARLTVGYRRLEDIVRARSGLNSHGAKLFSEAFGEKGPLTWDVRDPSECVGRVNLFRGSFMTYRNPRAHRVITDRDALGEFLLLNQLFLLEAEAIKADERLRGEPREH